MISVEYVQMMARYNAWQNGWMMDAVKGLDMQALQHDRGAFFGSIFGTMNHLLWGDLLWLSRFDGGAGPSCGIAQSVDLHPTADSWAAQRVRTDGRIKVWAKDLRPAQLREDMTWESLTLGRSVTKSAAVCVAHFFNHQTHHRGQMHAMLTQTGCKTEDTDLFLLP